MSTDAIVLNLNDSPLWAPYKALYHTVYSALMAKDIDAIPDLEAALKNHKPDFICLLKNPVRSQIHREAVKKASTIGIAVAGQPGLQILTQQLVDEAVIISDMFDLNELTSLELLIAGQQQQPHFPGLTRGLVAMLLYYDGRRSLVNALRTLVQAREGRSWTLGLTNELTSLVTNFTNQLKEEGLIMNVIGLIENMDIASQLELLHKNRALGGPRYRKQVKDLIAEIKQSLAEIIFCWACQGTLTFDEVMRLLTHLTKQSGLSSNGSLDEPTAILVMAFLYVIDVGYLQTCEESDPCIQKLNLIACPDLVPAIQRELCAESRWQIEGIKSIFQFAWGVTLRTLSQFPLSSVNTSFSESLEDEEKFIDLAIGRDAFTAVINLIFRSSLFHQEEFFLKRIHSLITDFIVLMPIKVKDMRNRGDESAKIIAAHVQEGLEPPANLPLHFQQFLHLIALLYEKNPLGLDLALDYWCPIENLMELSFVQRPTQKQVSLFKFVRLAGDLLPAPLFVSYHQMLTSLSSSKLCAHHCYNLLKMNGRNVVGSHYNLVSWDHFFSTLHVYYNNLREELALAPDARHTYRQRMLTKGITPQEVQGLDAVLRLISQVVKLDDVARITLFENPQYSPCIVYLGLITCSVPPMLKASLLRCLASFAKSPEISLSIWHGLEAAQIIPTVPSTSVYYPSGILMEIEEVETRNEEYPITVAILELISNLLDHPYPMTLGTGQRQPGIQPYLDFVRDKILLKYNSKSYRSQKQKWKIVILCLQIMEKVLRSYQPNADMGFANQSLDSSILEPGCHSMHPGYNIISEMLRDSGLLRVILYILDDGMRILDMYSPYQGQKNLEKGTLLALTLLCETLSKQDTFLEYVRNSNSDLLVTSLENLLMSINPRSGQVDHLFVIAKYITYNTIIPQHSLLAISILLLLCASRQVAQHFVGIFEIDPKESEILLNGFVECLEVDVSGEVETDKTSPDEDSMINSRNKARQQLLLLLLNCLKFPGPNLSHYLLGFNLRRPIAQTEIQEPGVMSSRRTCLHAVLSLLDAGTSSNTGPINVYKSPYATALAYQLIYTLCANKDTSGPTLRYLRSTHDFFFRHLQFLPFKSKEKYDPKILSQQSWLLKALAIELRVTSAHHQRSHVQRLLLSFLDDKPSVENVSIDGVTEPISGMTTIASFSFIQPNTGPLRRKLMRILDSLDFDQMSPPPVHWDYFGLKELQKVFKECEMIEPSGLPLINTEKLHHRLAEEVSVWQNDPRYHSIQQEVASVLQYALDLNSSLVGIHTKKQSFDAWRQVTEVLLLACPLDMLGSEKKHQMVLEISQELIRRVMSEDFLPELMPPASGVILTLMATLRHSVFASLTYMKTPSFSDTTNLVSPFTLSSHAGMAITQYSSLLVVLKAIVECLLQTRSGLQRVRANFYTAFLNLLCIVQKPYDAQGGVSSSVEAAVLDQDSDKRKLRTEYMDTILSFGETIMEVICRDACTGHDITKMLAIAVLDVAVSLDTQQQWLAFLVSKGYLKHILDSLTKDDEELQNLLNRSSSSYRIFYVFESKMALLTRISSTSAGALALLRNGAIGKLSECRVLDLRPDLYVPPEMRREGESWILPDLMKCYRQILKAVMKLILSIMMSLGLKHQEANLQLLSYISYNTEFFLSILRDRSVLDSLEGLEELSLVTAMLSRAALEDPDDIATDTVLLETRGQLLLLRQHLLSLLPCLMVTENVMQWRHSTAAQADADTVSKIKLSRLQISAHILRLCCGAVTPSGFDANSCRVLFTPSLAEATFSLSSYDFGTQDLSIRHSATLGKTPDLGLIVKLLYQCSTQLQSSIDNHKLLLLRLQSLATLTSDELAEYLPTEVKVEHMTAHHQRELARECLHRLLQYRVKEVSLLSYMIESSAFILLKHLEYFLIVCKKSEIPYSSSQSGDTTIRRLQDTQVKQKTDFLQDETGRFPEPVLSQQELENFKAEVSSVFLESFFRKLHSVEQHLGKGRSHVSFLEAIVHRLKRLVRLQM